MRPQLFPVCMDELLGEILSVQLAEKVSGCLRGRAVPTSLNDIYAIANEMRTSLRLGCSHTYGPLPDRSAPA
jgi:hypothetical protein